MLLHRPMHGGGSLTDNHRLLLLYATGGSPDLGVHSVLLSAYRKTHSRGSPSDTHGLQTALVKGFVVSHQWQSFNHWFYLSPYVWEYRCIFSIVAAKPMYLTAPVVVVIRLWLDKRVERINYLAIPYDDYSDATNTASLVVSCFKIYCSKIFHYSVLPNILPLILTRL